MPPQQPQVDWSKAKPIAAPDVDWSKAAPVNASPESHPPGYETMRDIVQGIPQALVGAGKGLHHTISSADEFMRAHAPAFMTNEWFGFGKPTDIAKEREYEKPEGTAQNIGYGGEQAAEFLAPGGLEEKGAAKLAELAPKLGKVAKPLARMITSGIGSGAVNTAQGGSPTTGALLGAGGTGAGELLHAAAPTLTGIAQGLKPEAFGKTGKAILNEPRGVMPGAIRKSARGIVNELTPELNAAADSSPAMIPMASAREAANEQIGTAMGQNEPRLKAGTKKMARQLSTRTFEPGIGAEGPSATLPIPDEVPAREYLELKRGIGKALPAGSWSPESTNAFKGPRNSIYGTMAKEFENAVPEAAPLNRRINALIPATEAPKNFLYSHPLGPGAGAILGGLHGYRRAGIPGAIEEGMGGAAAGLLVPAAMNTAARIGYSPALQRAMVPAATGAILQADRKKKE